MTMPNYDIPAEMRDLAEESVAHARSAFEGILNAAQTAVGRVDTSVVSAHSSAKDIGSKAMSYAEINARSVLDLAQKLVQAKTWQEVFALQSDYARSQMAALQEQAKELGTLMQPGKESAVQPAGQSKSHEQNLLDESLEESFPASDPVASNRFD